MSASNVIRFPIEPQSPPAFPQWAHDVLVPLIYARPLWDLIFAQGDNGDVSAILGDPEGPNDRLLHIIPRKGFVEVLTASSETSLGTFTAPEDLRRAALEFL